MPMEEIKGYVEHIVFRNEENGYTVFTINNEDGELTCVGSFSFIEEGELLKLQGEYTTHKMYGLQFAVSYAEACQPEDLLSIEKYLGSGAIKGIREAMAGKIVKKFKEDTFRIIEEEPERLAEIKGISLKKAREISAQVEEKKSMRQAMMFLQKYGVSMTLAAKIYKHYGADVYHVLEENPYQIIDAIPGVGFKTADEIAGKIGIRVDSDFRIQSGLYYVLLDAVNEGHIYQMEKTLVAKTSRLLHVDIEHPESYLMNLAMDKKVIIKDTQVGNRIYPSRYYYMELNVAKMLIDLNVNCMVKAAVPDEQLLGKIRKIEEAEEISLDEKQRQAVVMAARKGLFVMTGGPGTGKTTTINVMIRFFESLGLDILLAAPTGRAAKRMEEATGYKAQTIHRLLEVSGNPEEEGSTGFQRNSDNPLETDVLIIDEMSMVDLPLMQALLRAIVPGTRLVLVGDGNQLPSVGPGSVLKDILAAEAFSVVKLTKIFRQAGESDIVVNAHKINKGEEVSLDNKSMDFFFLKRQDPTEIIGILIMLIQKKLPKFVNASPYDIQVLTPMRKGVLGVERLNQIMQQYLNPPEPGKQEKQIGDRLFRVGDKVMQIKNNYQMEWEVQDRHGIAVDKGIGVFNGDMGVVKEIDSYNERIKVLFDEQKMVEYPYDSLEELELSYAITIHKAQGSEYPAVLIPLLQGPRQLYHRNLLYTAVTRARKCVTIVGSDTVFRDMIANVNEQRRNTSLAGRIQEMLNG